MLRSIAEKHHWIPQMVLDMPVAQFWAIYMPSRIRRPSSMESLNAHRNRQRIKAGKAPLLIR